VTVAGLLLAAGEGRRLGRPKAVVELGGRRLVDLGVALLRDGGCAPVVVVLGAAVVDVPGARVVVNDDWRTGMGSSLRHGLHAMPGDVDAVVVALADQPRIGSEAVRRLVGAHLAGARAAVATYGGEPRNPALLDRSVWAEVTALAEGDTGARAWLRAHPDQVTPVPCDGTGDPVDVDTEADLATLRDQPGSTAAGARRSPRR
jgi:CTP:molybdopterin cytidylyltransferase MocA